MNYSNILMLTQYPNNQQFTSFQTLIPCTRLSHISISNDQTVFPIMIDFRVLYVFNTCPTVSLHNTIHTI